MGSHLKIVIFLSDAFNLSFFNSFMTEVPIIWKPLHLLHKSLGRFLYDRGLCHEKVTDAICNTDLKKKSMQVSESMQVS